MTTILSQKKSGREEIHPPLPPEHPVTREAPPEKEAPSPLPNRPEIVPERGPEIGPKKS